MLKSTREGDFFFSWIKTNKNGVGAADFSIWWFWAMMNKWWSQQKLMHGAGVGDG